MSEYQYYEFRAIDRALTAADHLGNGWSAEEILRQYPHLTAAEVHAALGMTFP